MSIENVGELISEFVPLTLIVDSQGFIIWASKEAKEDFKIKPKQVKFEEKFELNLKVIKNNDVFKAEINERKYIVKPRLIKLEDVEYIFVFFEIICTFENKNIKVTALEEIIDKINDGIMMSDYKGKIVVYNNAMEKLEDKSSKDMVGKYLWDAYGYEGEDKSEHRRVFHSGEAVLNKYEAHAYNNGIPKYVSYSTFPLVINDETVGVYTISRNETKLHTLLSETIELKRKVNKDENKEKDFAYKTNGTTFTFSDIIGSSEQMIKLIKEAQSIAWLDNNVLIVGNTGTGKEVFAQSIHNFGKRKDSPFIGINCSAIPENLLESILFGTVKGAYTGALDHTGLFEEAKDGTLFLDELNSMPINMQTKLLRVLQERRVRRVGGNITYPIKCRIISAMNEDPIKLIEKGKLREDLYYRIAGFNLYIPPLHERTRDIYDLSDYFIRQLNISMGRSILALSKELKKVMQEYTWPGNVRELQHFIENLMVRVDENDRYLRICNIPDYIKHKIISSNAMDSIIDENESLPNTLNSLEKKIILESLEKNNWNISKTSRELGIIRQSLLYRMKKLNIEKEESV